MVALTLWLFHCLLFDINNHSVFGLLNNKPLKHKWDEAGNKAKKKQEKTEKGEGNQKQYGLKRLRPPPTHRHPMNPGSAVSQMMGDHLSDFSEFSERKSEGEDSVSAYPSCIVSPRTDLLQTLPAPRALLRMLEAEDPPDGREGVGAKDKDGGSGGGMDNIA
ncbi:hypothetical protein EV359DRAFT_69118, partial [Lentinula novae-zelandiae]